MGSFKLVKLIFLLAILRTNLGGKTFFDMLQKATKHSDFLREYESDVECIKDTLRLVTVVFRHGERTPADTYPTDPHINDSMIPYGWGQLTNEGKLNQYNQGLYLRKRYGKFLGTVYSPDIFYLRSTEVDRTKMSAMLEAAALWRPEQNQIFKEDLPWQPVTLHYEPRDKDNVYFVQFILYHDTKGTLIKRASPQLLLTTACPAYFQELDRVMKSAEIMKLQEENELMYQELRNFTGLNIRNPDDIWSLYGTLKAEADLNLTFPDWVKHYYPEKLEPLTKISYIIKIWNPLLQKLRGGPLVHAIVESMRNKTKGILNPNARKMYMYSGHDSSVTSLLGSLGVWELQMPEYNIMTMLELHEDQNGWNVQIFLRNSTKVEPYSLTLPGCAMACPFNDFLELVKPIIPEDWESECRVEDPNYIPPSPPPP